MSDIFIIGPESHIAHSRPISTNYGLQFQISSVLQNNTLMFVDFKFLNTDKDLMYRVTIDQAKLVLQKLTTVLNKTQLINQVLNQPTPSPMTKNSEPTAPTASSIIQGALNNPDFQLGGQTTPSEDIRQNTVPGLKSTSQANFSQEHLDVCVHALQQEDQELERSVFVPTQYLEEILLRGFDKQSLITTDIRTTLEKNKIKYDKKYLSRVLARLVEDKKITKQERVSKQGRNYTLYSFGDVKKKNSIQETLEEVLLEFEEKIFTKEDYLLVVKERQVDQAYAEQYLDEMCQEGNLLQPFEGKYKNV
ncbi:MAG: hypothetical protein HeimC3_52300 [Candidatus Heimdallarchaeota archaeon LC_3]|nr:MAG: hypothetical protein HeimC3_52300 [Candidatus Heimdallarchaeota archaeon LC_3]